MRTERDTPPPPIKRAPPLGPPLARDRPIDQQADQAAKERLLPRPPGKKITFDEMTTYLGSLTEKMWSHVTLYVYRDHPRILRKLKNPDTPKYIDCLSESIDMDYMIEHHGGGRYNIVVNDTEAKFNSEQNKLFEVHFEINESKYEPKLNYEELDINAKQNMAYVQLLQYRGILDSKGQVMATQPNGPGGNSDVVKQVLEFASKMNADQQAAVRARIDPNEESLSKSVGQILLEKMKQDDPAKNLSSLVTIIKEVMVSNKAPDAAGQLEGLLKVIKEVLASNKPPDGGTQLMGQIIQMQNDHNKTLLQLYEKLADARRNPDANPPMEQFEQLLSVAERLNGFRGGRGGGRSGWDIGLDYAKEIGVPLLQTIGNLMGLRNGARGPMGPGTPQPGSPATTAPAIPAQFDPYANPAATRAFANTLRGQPAGAQPAAPAAGAPVNELQALMQVYGGFIVNQLNIGAPGYNFGEWVVEGFGTAMHAQIAAQGEPALVQALLSTPETAIFGEQRLRKFVNEFVNYQEFLDQQEQDDQPEPEDTPVLAASGR